MSYQESTKLGAILEEHPWLEKELPRRYPELKSMANPAARFMVKRMSVQDASRMSGIPAQKLLQMLEELIGEVEKS